jgi:hypothetical protein
MVTHDNEMAIFCGKYRYNPGEIRPKQEATYLENP